MFIEIELKLHIKPADVELFYGHPVLKEKNTGKPVTQLLKNTYFDTEDYILRKHNYSLRIRETGNKKVQTLKSAGKREGNLRKRKEWEQKTTRRTPDLTLLGDSKLTIQLLKLIGNEPLIPLFTTNFERTTWEIQAPKDTVIELALDQGEICTDEATLIISELEIELKKGDPNQLNKFAETLRKTLPVTPEDRSKSSRGYKLRSI